VKALARKKLAQIEKKGIKDAPKLIGLLELETLTQTFDEANLLIDFIKMQ